MQKYDFRVDVCRNRHKYKPFTTGKTVCGFVRLENARVKKRFSATKKCRGGKKIIGRLLSKINTRFDKMGYKIFNDWQIGRGNKDASLESCLSPWTRQRYNVRTQILLTCPLSR